MKYTRSRGREVSGRRSVLGGMSNLASFRFNDEDSDGKKSGDGRRPQSQMSSSFSFLPLTSDERSPGTSDST